MTQPVSRHIAPTQDPQGLLFVVFLKLFFVVVVVVVQLGRS